MIPVTRPLRGFTLIELLVVIAIIGSISAIVLASLNTARDKARDAKLFTEMSNVRSAASIYYNTNNSYGSAYGSGATSGSCPTTGGAANAASMYLDTTSGMHRVILEIENVPGVSVTACYATANTWAVAANIPSVGTGEYWCVDSAGNSKRESGTLTATTLTSSLCP